MVVFFIALFNSSELVPFYPTIFLWESRVPLKVTALARLVAYKKVNTNDMLQLRWLFKTLPMIDASYVRVKKKLIISSYIIRFFLDCSIGYSHLLGWGGFNQAIFMIYIYSLKCFGHSTRGETLWKISCFTLLWIVWREGDASFFKDTRKNDAGLASLLCFFLGLIVLTSLKPILL